MGQLSESRRVIRFVDCEISTALRRLVRGGRDVAIQPKPFDLLVFLIDNRDRVVPVEEILREVWPGVRVNGQALRFALHAARRAVGDSGKTQTILRTVPRKGIQFIADVNVVDPRETYRGSTRRTRSSKLFIGRDHLLHSIESSLATVERGTGATLLISGEAGIGKSTSLERLGEVAAQKGLIIVNGHCIRTEGAPAFWPWIQILRSATESMASRETRSIAERASEIDWIIPGFRPQGSTAVPSPEEDARSAQFRLFETVTRLVRELAQHRPLALLIDDLQHSDQASLDMLAHVAEESVNSPILIAVAYRDHGPGMAPKLNSATARLMSVSGCTHIPLTGFSAYETRTFVQSVSATNPSDVVLGDIQSKTNGNPFFVLQILQLLANEAQLDLLMDNATLDLKLPRGVQDIIGSRVEGLPKEVRDVVEAAAVIRKDFSAETIERMLRTSARSEVLMALDSAVSAGVLVRSAEPFGFRFGHALVQEVAFEGLTLERRSALQYMCGIALQDEFGPAPGPHCAEIANHFEAVLAPSVQKLAIGHLFDAAQWQIGRAGFEEAARCLERAKRLATRLCPDDTELRCQLLVSLGMTLGLAGDREGSQSFLKQGAKMAEECGRADLLGEAALHYAPDLLAIETGVYDSDLVDLLSAALRALTKRDSLRARVLARLAVALHWSDAPPQQARELIEEAEEIATERADLQTADYVHVAGTLASYSVSKPAGCLRRNESVGFTARDTQTELMRGVLRITSSLQLGRMRDVLKEIDTFRDLARASGRRSAAWYGDMLLATVALMEGRYRNAKDYRLAYLRDGLKVSDENALHSFALQEAISGIDLGEIDQRTEERVSGMAMRFPRVEGWQAGLCYLYCELGMNEQARALFERAWHEGLYRCRTRNSWFGTICSLTLAAEHLRLPASARPLFARLKAFSGQLAVVGFGSLCWGSIDRFLAILARQQGNEAIADQHLAFAIQQNQACGALPALAYCYRDQANALAERDIGAADRARGLARSLAARLGMRGLGQKIDRDADVYE